MHWIAKAKRQAIFSPLGKISKMVKGQEKTKGRTKCPYSLRNCPQDRKRRAGGLGWSMKIKHFNRTLGEKKKKKRN